MVYERVKKEIVSFSNQKQEKRMIMSKKKSKKPNTFLQSKNKKNMGSSKTKEYSPIKFDRFGRVCRFVNRKCDVLPTDTEMFGCEIVRDLPNEVREFLKIMNLGVVIDVPVSNHEHLTGSGKKGECHNNSHMMSLSIGGHRLWGYSIERMVTTLSSGSKENGVRFHHHSVWNTPEDKTRCVTDYGHRYHNQETKWFIPIGLNTIEETFFLNLDEIVVSRSGKRIDYLNGGNGDDRKEVVQSFKKKDLIRLSKTGESPFLHKVEFEPNLDMDIFWKEDIEDSDFGKVSSSTGRSWNYFKDKILNTYFPTSTTTKTPKIVI